VRTVSHLQAIQRRVARLRGQHRRQGLARLIGPGQRHHCAPSNLRAEPLTSSGKRRPPWTGDDKDAARNAIAASGPFGSIFRRCSAAHSIEAQATRLAAGHVVAPGEGGPGDARLESITQSLDHRRSLFGGSFVSSSSHVLIGLPLSAISNVTRCSGARATAVGKSRAAPSVSEGASANTASGSAGIPCQSSSCRPRLSTTGSPDSISCSTVHAPTCRRHATRSFVGPRQARSCSRCSRLRQHRPHPPRREDLQVKLVALGLRLGTRQGASCNTLRRSMARGGADEVAGHRTVTVATSTAE